MKLQAIKNNKAYQSLFLILFFTLFIGCSKSNDTSPTNPYGGTNGQTTFWASNYNTSLYPITVTVNGKYIGTIGGSLNAAPDCQNATDKVVKYDNVPGTYNFACTAAGNLGDWTGSVTITQAGCYAAQLK